jgi:hypothetical protein
MSEPAAGATITPPAHGWDCFHCGEHFEPTFAGQQAARLHFGDTPDREPACRIDARRFRAMEETCERYQQEDTALHRQLARKETEMAAAVRRADDDGYAKAVADYRPLVEAVQQEHGGKHRHSGCPTCVALEAVT